MKLFIEEWMMIGILVILVVLVCAGVLSRYVFGWSLSFTEEFTRYLLIWLTCLGFSASGAREDFIRFQWPENRPAWLVGILRWIGKSAAILFALVLLISSTQVIELQWRYDQRTSVMGWPILWVSLAFPLACFLFLWRMISRIRNVNRSGRERIS